MWSCLSFQIPHVIRHGLKRLRLAQMEKVSLESFKGKVFPPSKSLIATNQHLSLFLLGCCCWALKQNNSIHCCFFLLFLCMNRIEVSSLQALEGGKTNLLCKQSSGHF